MIIPDLAWKRKIGESLQSPGVVKVDRHNGGMPNFDDGYYQGMPLGGFGTGTLSQSFRGDFSRWHLELGHHLYQTIFPCQFGIFEDGKAFILNDHKPTDGSLKTWNFQKQNGTYHALYPTAYFEYPDLNIIQEQFSPIIPHNYQEISYPVAIFRWHIRNNKDTEREISILWSWQSLFGSKENVFYQENAFAGLIFDNLIEEKTHKYGQMGIFVQQEDVEVSFLNSFQANGDGSELWDMFSNDGALISELKPQDSKKLKDSPGAICAKIKVGPKDHKTITFVLAWDFPIVEFGLGVKWYKKYTNLFGKDGRNLTRIARKAFNNRERWHAEIKKWHHQFLKSNKPDWLKMFLLNELYYLVDGGTTWTAGRHLETLPPEVASKLSNVERPTLAVRRQEEHFGSLECFDYPFYETLDVRFYGSFPLLILWPDLEKLVLKDYLKAINLEMKEKKLFDHPLDQTTAERKVKGAAPHDLGSSTEDPFLKVNAYPHVNVNKWKDLNSKFVLMIYRYFYFTGKKDVQFLTSAWTGVVDALNYLKQFDKDNDCLIENENIPDQTYDNWTMHGESTYCNGLWLAALKAAVEIGKIIQKDYKDFQGWLETGKKNLESKLWNESYYLFDTKSNHGKNIMADQLCGQWYADLLGLGDIFQYDRVQKTLKTIFDFNVMKIGNGKIGAINGINPDGSLLPESKVWKQNTQSNEIWSGVTFALASHMSLRGLKEEAMKTAFGIYSVVYETKGYWFRTPEAWDVDGNFRASLYQRPGAVWALTVRT